METPGLFSLSLLVDLGLGALLLTVIVLALRLDHRLKAIRDNSGELRTLIKGLNDATERAHQAVAQLSAAGRESKATLGASIAKARELSDELSLMTQSADSLASRLSNTPRADVQPITKEEPKESVSKQDRNELRQLLSGVR
ncbi:MAG: DUF6468 domain-containing protein [Pseudomonadota bacterium]